MAPPPDALLRAPAVGPFVRYAVTLKVQRVRNSTFISRTVSVHRWCALLPRTKWLFSKDELLIASYHARIILLTADAYTLPTVRRKWWLRQEVMAGQGSTLFRPSCTSLDDLRTWEYAHLTISTRPCPLDTQSFRV